MITRFDKVLTTTSVLALYFFIVLKVIRGFEADAEAGGIWNYIQIFFVGLGATLVLNRNFNSKRRIDLYREKPFAWLLLYSALSFAFAIPFLQGISASSLFSLLKIPYGCAILIVFAYVGYARKLDDAILKWGVPIVFYLTAVIYIVNRSRFYSADAEGGMVADVYYVLGLTPLAMHYMKPRWKFVPLLVAAIAIVLSTKRLGLFALAAMLFVYGWSRIREKGEVKSRVKIILAIVFVASLLFYVATYLNQEFAVATSERMESLSYDGGSNRDILWAFVWARIEAGSVLEWIFGHGVGAVLDVRGQQAHNDFLQIAYEHGFLALIAYIGFYVAQIKTIRRMYDGKYPKSAEYATAFVILCALATASFCFIDATHITPVCATLGLLYSDWLKTTAEAETENAKRKRRSKRRISRRNDLAAN